MKNDSEEKQDHIDVNEENVQLFAARLKEIRLFRGISQGEIAQRLKVSRTLVAYWETEGRRPNGKDILIRLSRILDVPLDYLLGNIDTWRKTK